MPANNNQVAVRRNTSTQTQESILEHNISRVPITDSQLLKMFNALDTEGEGLLSLDTVRTFYTSLDHLGIQRPEEEITRVVGEFCCTKPGFLSLEEFSCFMLKISSW